MSMCADRSGILGCPYEAAGVEPHAELCYWHGKKAGGLFSCNGSRNTPCAKPAGHKPPCSPVPLERRALSPDDQVSDEHQEIMRILRRESA